MKDISQQLARQLKEFLYGQSMTGSSLKNVLEDVGFKEAVFLLDGFNTIAMLSYHINYYMKGGSDVLAGQPLVIRDKFSFDCPDFQTEIAWTAFKQEIFEVADVFAKRIEELDSTKLEESFTDNNYGNYFRNLIGLLEHSHYHLGQIVILKKMIRYKGLE